MLASYYPFFGIMLAYALNCYRAISETFGYVGFTR